MYIGDKGSSKGARILVVRLSSMGDIIHALPAVATLKHSFPASHLSWVVRPAWAPLLEGNPFIDRLVLLERRDWGAIRKAWKELRQIRYDFAVDFQGLIQSALVASAARPDRIYGFHQSQLREKLAALFYSNRVFTNSKHVVDQNLDLASAAGAGGIVRAFPLPPGRPEGHLPPEGFVLACPLAGWRSKQWPLDYYGDLAVLLRREIGYPLVLNGPPESLPLLERVPDVNLHVSGLPGLIDATRRAVAVVGIDSGPLHLAAALAKPGVAIFGPTDPARNGPYGETVHVLRSPNAVTTFKRGSIISESMREISPRKVAEAVRAAMVLRPRSSGAAR